MKAAAQALDDPAEASRRQAMRPARAPEPDTTAEQILAAAARLFGRQGFQRHHAAPDRRRGRHQGRQRLLPLRRQGRNCRAGARRRHPRPQRGRAQPRRRRCPRAALRGQRLAAAVEGHLWGMLHHGDFTAAHIRIYRNVSDAARARHRPVRSAYTRLWDVLLADCAAAGVLRRDIPVPMVRQFLVGALNWPVDWYDTKRGSFERFAAQITALVFDGIVVEPEPAP
jgi:hypothetical protein